MSTDPRQLLEVVGLSPTLFLRFWDSALESPPFVPLQVRVRLGGGQRTALLARTQSGGYVWHRVARDGVPETLDAEVTVADPGGDWVPTKLPLQLPVDATAFSGRTPSNSQPPVAMFSSVHRTPRNGFARVLAQLRGAPDPDTGAPTPASGAIVAVTVGQQSWYGLADEQGQVAVLIPPAATIAEPVPATVSVRYGRTPLADAAGFVDVAAAHAQPAARFAMPIAGGGSDALQSLPISLGAGSIVQLRRSEERGGVPITLVPSP